MVNYDLKEFAWAYAVNEMGLDKEDAFEVSLQLFQIIMESIGRAVLANSTKDGGVNLFGWGKFSQVLVSKKELPPLNNCTPEKAVAIHLLLSFLQVDKFFEFHCIWDSKLWDSHKKLDSMAAIRDWVNAGENPESQRSRFLSIRESFALHVKLTKEPPKAEDDDAYGYISILRYNQYVDEAVRIAELRESTASPLSRGASNRRSKQDMNILNELIERFKGGEGVAQTA